VSESRICVVALLAMLAAAGCTGERARLYPGPARPPDTVALLKHQTGWGNPSVYFVRIDGTVLPKQAKKFFDVELPPGRHEIEYGYEAANELSIENAVVIFTAEAGHQYEARAERPTPGVLTVLFGGKILWSPAVVDLGTNQVVSTAVRASTTTPAP
jgi:hypothetical protein